MESAHYNTPIRSKLRSWVLDVPPIRIQSNKLGATRTEVHVCGS